MNSFYLNEIFEEQSVKYNKLNTTLNSPFDDLTYQVLPFVFESKSQLVEPKILLKVSLSIGQLQKHLNVICLMKTMDTDFSTILFQKLGEIENIGEIN